MVLRPRRLDHVLAARNVIFKRTVTSLSNEPKPTPRLNRVYSHPELIPHHDFHETKQDIKLRLDSDALDGASSVRPPYVSPTLLQEVAIRATTRGKPSISAYSIPN